MVRTLLGQIGGKHTSTRRLLAGMTLALLLGCQQSPPSGPVNAPPQSLTSQLQEEGDALAARGDYAAAAVKYQAAVSREPDDVSLHFALGVALSHLNRREETIEQFRWVVTRGVPGSPEVQAARRWLVDAGELGETVTLASSAPSPTPEPPAAESPSTGKLMGKTEPSGAARQINLALLKTDEQKSEPVSFSKRLELGEAYEFDQVPAGKYRLTAEDLETRALLWDLEVTVTAKKDTTLDLTNANRKPQ